jgi:hypothetical protein
MHCGSDSDLIPDPSEFTWELQAGFEPGIVCVHGQHKSLDWSGSEELCGDMRLADSVEPVKAAMVVVMTRFLMWLHGMQGGG